jgi:hypothetical protein
MGSAVLQAFSLSVITSMAPLALLCVTTETQWVELARIRLLLPLELVPLDSSVSQPTLSTKKVIPESIGQT